jgi:ligand-binding SRPBCC domain-containing protein
VQNSAELFELRTQIWLPRPVEQVFAFFADAGNLPELTPPWLQFQILTARPIPMHAGAIIDYKLRIRGLPVKWKTEITAWEPPFRFVDEQRKGPYLVWVHEHRFRSLHGGTEVEDFVRYRPPGGWLVDRLLVRRDVRNIFGFRQQRLQELFPPG